jgi:uncharacterized repeat protein (TIGR03803 family)
MESAIPSPSPFGKHRFAAWALAVALSGCAAGAGMQPTPMVRALAVSQKIHHVVIIFQENRSVDDLFNGLPGADTVRSGENSEGKHVTLRPISLSAPYDLGHSHASFETEYAAGKLDGFDNESSNCYAVNVCLSADVRAYGYVPHTESAPYFVMAKSYAFADRMFQTNEGPSFPAHQYIVSGTSSITDGSPLRAAENPFNPPFGAVGGCDSPEGSLVMLIDSAGNEEQSVYPCFDRTSLMKLIEAKSLSWRYYQANLGPGLWNGPDAVLNVRKSPEFSADVVAPSSQILNDVAKGRLADVVWVTPTALASDHAHATNATGPSWVAAVVNAIGKSPYWKDTAIFVTWDDWGGWYDHVKPPVFNSYELGFRVPLIVISPFAKNHYVSHRQHEFGSILKFAETIFGLGSLHTTDERSDDLFDCFDFMKAPSKFVPIPAPFPARYFFKQPLSQESPDDDSSYTQLYAFGRNGKRNDGAAPQSRLAAVGGTLYGTTQYGGLTRPACPLGCGTIYRITASGNEVIAYRFAGAQDGAGPLARLIEHDGALFGTTAEGGGGSACTDGCGTVFETDGEGKGERVLYAFKGDKDGARPLAGVLGIGAMLYGTTSYGGAHPHVCPSGCGTIFSLSTDGKSESIVHAFTGSGGDGSQPAAPLTEMNGLLYGTTQYGGQRTPFCSIGCGTVFSVDPKNGRYRTVYLFDYAPPHHDGAYPQAGLVALKGVLYGTTLGGGKSSEGTVFKVDVSGTEHVTHSFSCCKRADGIYPLDALVSAGGVLYGTTRNGGMNGTGTIFTMTRAGAESVLYSFPGRPGGTEPVTSLFDLDGVLYGTTEYGGGTNHGTVFAYTP